jgi:hypothetical protein
MRKVVAGAQVLVPNAPPQPIVGPGPAARVNGLAVAILSVDAGVRRNVRENERIRFPISFAARTIRASSIVAVIVCPSMSPVKLAETTALGVGRPQLLRRSPGAEKASPSTMSNNATRRGVADHRPSWRSSTVRSATWLTGPHPAPSSGHLFGGK